MRLDAVTMSGREETVNPVLGYRGRTQQRGGGHRKRRQIRGIRHIYSQAGRGIHESQSLAGWFLQHALNTPAAVDGLVLLDD